MARARNIKPSLFKNEVLGVADPIYTIVFQGLWVLADKEGRLEDRPLRIKAEILPYRDGINMDEILNWLNENGFIYRYSERIGTSSENIGSARGKHFIQIINFKKHQNPHKNETESEIPAPDFLQGKKAEEEKEVQQPIEEKEENKSTERIGTSSENIGSARADSLNLIPDSPILIPEDDIAVARNAPSSPHPCGRKQAQAIVDLFNNILDLPKVKDLNDERYRSIQSRWKQLAKTEDVEVNNQDVMLMAFEHLLKYINESDFLTGRNGKWNNCSFDWIFKKVNFTKILEGNYENKEVNA